MNSYKEVATLGSGTLFIDAIAGSCEFEGGKIESLWIARELQAWLREDLSRNAIPAAAVKTASLKASLMLSHTNGKARSTSVQHLAADGKPIRTGGFFRLAIDCESEITTDETRYSSRMKDVEEWPENWP